MASCNDDVIGYAKIVSDNKDVIANDSVISVNDNLFEYRRHC